MTTAEHERLQLYRELAQAAQEARLLDAVLDGVTAASDQNELIRTVGFGIKELLPYERWSRVTLSLLDDRRRLQVYQLIAERNNPFWDTVGQGIHAAAAELGVEVSFAMATMAGPLTQTTLIDQAIRDGVSGIGVAPADAEALEPAIRRARAAGIPLVTFATPSIPQSAALLDIGTDDLRAGRLAGQALARLLPGGGTIGTSVYSPEQLNMRQRIAGVEEALAGTGLIALPPLAVRDDRARGLELARELLAAHPDLAGALGAASLNGPIWAQALAEAGRGAGAAVVGFDLVPATVALLKEGRIQATVVQREYDMGFRSVELLSRMVAGGVEATLARLPAGRLVETGLDVVTLDRTPWSVALADYLRRPGRATADRATVELVGRHGRPIRLLLIGILPEADPDITSQDAELLPGSLVERVVAAERTLVVSPRGDEGGAIGEAYARGARTLVGVPLRAERRVVGVLMLESGAADACTPADRQLLERMASAVVVALENARLFRQSAERQRALEDAAERQELLLQTILDLSSPVAEIVPGILVMPLIGTIDSQRASRFLETLLSAVSTREARLVLIDITGVPLVDTSVADSIIHAAQATQMLGAEMVLVGITPAVAQTMVSLGIDLSQITTRGDLAGGLSYALGKLGGRIIYKVSDSQG